MLDVVITDGTARHRPDVLQGVGPRDGAGAAGAAGLFAGKVGTVPRPAGSSPTRSYELDARRTWSTPRSTRHGRSSRSTRPPSRLDTWDRRREPCAGRARPCSTTCPTPLPAEVRARTGCSTSRTTRCAASTPPRHDGRGRGGAASGSASRRRFVLQVVAGAAAAGGVRRSRRRRARPGAGGLLEAFDARLPFELTAGQREVGDDDRRRPGPRPPDAPAAPGRGRLRQDRGRAARDAARSSTPAARPRCSRRPRCSPSSTTARSPRCSATSPRAACSAAPTTAPGSRCSPARQSTADRGAGAARRRHRRGRHRRRHPRPARGAGRVRRPRPGRRRRAAPLRRRAARRAARQGAARRRTCW